MSSQNLHSTEFNAFFVSGGYWGGEGGVGQYPQAGIMHEVYNAHNFSLMFKKFPENIKILHS